MIQWSTKHNTENYRLGNVNTTKSQRWTPVPAPKKNGTSRVTLATNMIISNNKERTGLYLDKQNISMVTCDTDII
jgi:hypothetical protein